MALLRWCPAVEPTRTRKTTENPTVKIGADRVQPEVELLVIDLAACKPQVAESRESGAKDSDPPSRVPDRERGQPQSSGSKPVNRR